MARWVLSRPETFTEVEQLRLKAVLANCPELDALTSHVRSFAQMLTDRQGQRLPEWLDIVRQDDLPSLHTLAAGIDGDRDAVIAGLTLPWNSGMVEGHVNRASRSSASDSSSHNNLAEHHEHPVLAVDVARVPRCVPKRRRTREGTYATDVGNA
ncbi:hypothetical protein [Streptomyces sp. NPDC048295]|uniref:hypothetical protein n=1 Tax=Streptomyces sp. NPDC048295 TaxID=3154617 RepID=UPI00343CD3B3